jgi:hypothetical protein
MLSSKGPENISGNRVKISTFMGHSTRVGELVEAKEGVATDSDNTRPCKTLRNPPRNVRPC